MKNAKTPINVLEQIESMLKHKTFEQLLEDEDIYNIEGARKKLGYSAWGLRRRCLKGQISYFMRGDQYFFLASQIRNAFKSA